MPVFQNNNNNKVPWLIELTSHHNITVEKINVIFSTKRSPKVQAICPVIKWVFQRSKIKILVPAQSPTTQTLLKGLPTEKFLEINTMVIKYNLSMFIVSREPQSHLQVSYKDSKECPLLSRSLKGSIRFQCVGQVIPNKQKKKTFAKSS